MRKITHIIIHHSAVEQPDINKLILSINRTHKERLWQPADVNWSTAAYHFVIWVDWEIRQTRDINSIWWHTHRSINKSSIWVCLSWRFDYREPTKKQYIALNDLISSLNFQFPWIQIWYHNTYNKSKTCPGRMFDKNKVLSYKDLIMSIFKSVREKEVRASDRLFSDYKQDDRPISIEDAKYLIDIAIARDNINDKNFVQRVFTWLLNILKK